MEWSKRVKIIIIIAMFKIIKNNNNWDYSKINFIRAFKSNEGNLFLKVIEL